MNRKYIRYKLFLIIFLAIGVIANGVFITLYNVDKSVNIGSVSKEMEKLTSENNKLVEEISVSDSLTRFLKLSETAGYTTNVKVLYFDNVGAVAQAR